MAASSADIVVNILTKVQDSGTGKIEEKFGKFGSVMKKAMVPAIAATGAVVAFGVAAVSSASRLQQAMGGVDAVFGKNAGTVKKWAADAAGSIGLAKSEYGELATLIGSQLKNAGLPMDEVTKKTKSLIDTGADLAAMYGGTTAEAVEALSSAMKGEFDPMEKYGASLSAAKISAEQVAKGTDKLTGKAADQAKMMATLGLITKQTTDAQGAAAREQDTVAARTQQANAQFENMKATLGTALLPYVAKFMGYLARLAVWAQKNAGVVQILAGVLLALAAAVLVVNVAMLVLSANPVVLIIAGIVAVVIALAIALTVAYKKSATFRKIVDGAFAGVKKGASAVVGAFKAIGRAVSAVFGWIKSHWRLLAAILFGPVAIAAYVIAKNWGRIRTGVAALLSWIKSAFRATFALVTAIVRGYVETIRFIIRTIHDAAAAVVGYLGGKFKSIWGLVKSVAVAAMSPIVSAVDKVTAAFNRVIGAVESLIGWISRIKIPSALSKIPGLGSLSAPAPAVPSSANATRLGRTPHLSSRATAVGASGGSPVNITVNGAIDPESTARQIARLMERHGRRVGVSA